MLVRVTSKVWSKDQRIANTTSGDTILFNGSGINGLKIRATTKSQFMFSEALNRDRRENASYVEAEQSVATIVRDIAKTWNTNMVLLNFYTDNDTSKATYAMRIACESISYVYKNGATRSYVVYYEGGKRRELLCTYSVKQVWSIVDDGDITTTAG